MALFRGIQEYIALDANNITLVFDSGNIVNISGNIFWYPPQGHPILYNSCNVIAKAIGFCMLIKTPNLTLAVNHATFQHSVVIIFAELLCVFRE